MKSPGPVRHRHLSVGCSRFMCCPAAALLENPREPSPHTGHVMCEVAKFTRESAGASKGRLPVAAPRARLFSLRRIPCRSNEGWGGRAPPPPGMSAAGVDMSTRCQWLTAQARVCREVCLLEPRKGYGYATQYMCNLLGTGMYGLQFINPLRQTRK